MSREVLAMAGPNQTVVDRETLESAFPVPDPVGAFSRATAHCAFAASRQVGSPFALDMQEVLCPFCAVRWGRTQAKPSCSECTAAGRSPRGVCRRIAMSYATKEQQLACKAGRAFMLASVRQRNARLFAAPKS